MAKRRDVFPDGSNPPIIALHWSEYCGGMGQTPVSRSFHEQAHGRGAELQETQHWLMRAKAYGYLSTAAFDPVWQMAKQVGRRLGSMLKSGDWSL